MKTLDLLNKALAINPSPKAWCDALKLTRSALNVARSRGRLSPVIAGGLAIQLGEPPEKWMVIAAMEAEPDSPLLTQLKAKFKECQYSLLVLLRQSNAKAESAIEGAFFLVLYFTGSISGTLFQTRLKPRQQSK